MCFSQEGCRKNWDINIKTIKLAPMVGVEKLVSLLKILKNEKKSFVPSKILSN